MSAENEGKPNMDIFHNWTPREIEAMHRATAWLRAKQSPYESEQPKNQHKAAESTREQTKGTPGGQTEYSRL